MNAARLPVDGSVEGHHRAAGRGARLREELGERHIRRLFRARKGMAALARTSVLPEATPVCALSARSRHSRVTQPPERSS
jgi:hypothetical protein